MKINIFHFIYPVLTLLIFTDLLFAQPAQEIEKGKIIEKIVCRHNTSESYSLYLPTKYSAKSKWPVLFAFDPAARTKVPLKLFKTAAEKYNYIVVCPANVRNGPRIPAADAMLAVWQDICSRFAVDKQRVYATGFSGGSRMSTFFKFVIKNPVKGIIACGAALSLVVKPEQVKSTAYFGIVGFADFNYREMVELDRAFDGHRVTHRFIYFDAKHRWPPEPILTRAVEWLELQAVKQSAAPRNQAFIDTIFEKELTAAQELEASGSIYFAVLAYESAARDFKGMKPGAEIEKIQQIITRLKAAREFKKFKKEEQRRLQKERDYIKKFAGVFGFIKQSNAADIRVHKILPAMEIKQLENQFKKGKNIYDTGFAERLLYNLGNQAMREGDGFLDKSDYIRAALFLEISAASSKGTYFYSYVLYRLASVYALQNKKKKALKFLEEAVENGYTYLPAIKADKNLAAIRNSPLFKKIIRRLEDSGKE